MTNIKCEVISIIETPEYRQGDVIETNEIDEVTLSKYFKRIKTNKPQTMVILPARNSGYGLDNLGLLQKNGSFIFDSNLKLVKLEKEEKQVEKQNK